MKTPAAIQSLRLQSGFTLIELVMVIVILAVLASVAIPKFVDLGSDAKAAALNGVAGSLTSAAAINYASRKANSSAGNAVGNCVDVATSLQGGLPTGYTIKDGGVKPDVPTSCTVVQDATGNAATFNATGI
jgi:MSHA pilin protein MshA